MKHDSVDLSVVIPVYCSAGIFPTLYRRLLDTLSTVTDSFEIIAVVDGCNDDSAQVVAQINASDPRVKLIEFSRNFGNQLAITAGLRHASGERVVVIDDDLEDPPELIPRLLAKADQGYDVVYAVRVSRKIPYLRHKVFRGYARVFRMLSHFDMKEDVGDFCLMSRPVVDALNAMPENRRFIRGLRAWAGFRQVGVEFDREVRHSGESGFNLRRYMRIGFDGIFGFSDAPLICSTYLGLLFALVGFGLGGWMLLAHLGDGARALSGWAAAVAALFFIGGVQLLSLGVLGQYISRIYDEVKGRPPYIIKHAVGFDRHAVAQRQNAQQRQNALQDG